MKLFKMSEEGFERCAGKYNSLKAAYDVSVTQRDAFTFINLPLMKTVYHSL